MANNTPLSTKNYKDTLSKELIKQASKCDVRECDENEKGHRQAYVDEKDSSFDVSVHINNKGEIIEHHCDCNSKSRFCQHKTALLLFLEKGGKTVGPKLKTKKKLSAVESLLEDVDLQQLKGWVKGILDKNKELELAFIHQFSERQQNYSPEEITKLTLNAVKAVIGNRKKMETVEAKNLADLWTKVHEPAIAQYHTSITDKESFLAFNAIVETCEEVNSGINTSSRRLDKYIEDLLLQIVEPLHNLQNDDAWDIASGFLIERINDTYVGDCYLSVLTQLHSRSTKERKERLAHRIAKQYADHKPKDSYESADVQSIFDIVKQSNLFSEYYTLFKPLYHQNDYNNDLIESLIEHNHLKIAEKYCLEQIDRNVREDYNAIYLEHLKNIYTIGKNDKKLAATLAVLTFETFDFTDYLFVCKHMMEDEKKKWRTRILTRASQSTSHNYKASLFQFQIMDHERNYKKMISYISSHTPYSIFVPYADKMAFADPKGFISRLFRLADSSWPDDAGLNAENSTYFPALFAIFLKQYTADELRLIIRSYEKLVYFKGNNFFASLKKHLEKE